MMELGSFPLLCLCEPETPQTSTAHTDTLIRVFLPVYDSIKVSSHKYKIFTNHGIEWTSLLHAYYSILVLLLIQLALSYFHTTKTIHLVNFIAWQYNCQLLPPLATWMCTTRQRTGYNKVNPVPPPRQICSSSGQDSWAEVHHSVFNYWFTAFIWQHCASQLCRWHIG